MLTAEHNSFLQRIKKYTCYKEWELEMIKVQETKVKESLQSMHDAMQRTVKRGNLVKEDIMIENRIFSIL